MSIVQNTVELGLVLWYDNSKHFGVIGVPGGGEYFLHRSNLASASWEVSKGMPVIFEAGLDSKKRKASFNVRTEISVADLKFVLSYLNSGAFVYIEELRRGVSRSGSSYVKKDHVQKGLVEEALKVIFSSSSNDQLFDALSYHNGSIDDEKFISYAATISRVVRNCHKSFEESGCLTRLYEAFGENISSRRLFKVWKSGQWGFIGLKDSGDVLPESVAREFANELEWKEAIRIRDYPYGQSFFYDFCQEKIHVYSSLTDNERRSLHSVLDKLSSSEAGDLGMKLSETVVNLLEKQIAVSVDTLPTIKSLQELKSYEQLKNIVPNYLPGNLRDELFRHISQRTVAKCDNSFKIELFLLGYEVDVATEEYEPLFFDEHTTREKRLLLLGKVDEESRFQLLLSYAGRYSWFKAFELLEALFIRYANDYNWRFSLRDHAPDFEKVADNHHATLAKRFFKAMDSIVTENTRLDCFFQRLVKSIDVEVVLKNVKSLSYDNCLCFANAFSHDENVVREFLLKVFSENPSIGMANICYLAKSVFKDFTFVDFCEWVRSVSSEDDYYKLWEDKYVVVCPVRKLLSILLESSQPVLHIESWLSDELISITKANDILLSYLRQQQPIASRPHFYRCHSVIFFLLENGVPVNVVSELGKDIFRILLWFFKGDDSPDFELLKSKFVYFSSDDQCRIVKKLFYLKAAGRFDLNVESLTQLVRLDLNLVQAVRQSDSSVSVDFSTDVLIKAITSFERNGHFIAERDLFDVVISRLHQEGDGNFLLGQYFERCSGRAKGGYGYEANGIIRKIKFGELHWYFAISFPIADLSCIDEENHIYLHGNKGFHFESTLNAVKKLPGRKWNSELKHWGVPSRYEDEVLDFGLKHKFYFHFDSTSDSTNQHAVRFRRSEIPEGIKYCEGRKANKKHSIRNLDFWWCCSQACFQKCETIHAHEQWADYTLLDFLEILGLNTDEVNHMGDVISKGKYYQFIHLINRFNRLLEKLKCSGCGQMLCPVQTSHFAAHIVVRFSCVNTSCTENNKIVYLNHCLNGQCNNVIDSRVSRTCPNGLYICDKCGSCCSHSMFNYRLSNLTTVGGTVSRDLIDSVQHKTGHLERAVYFCHNGHGRMSETMTDVFQCTTCYVTYDTTRFRLKRPHRDLEDSKSPSS